MMSLPQDSGFMRRGGWHAARYRYASGFTLVEAIIAIVLTAIIAGVVSVFIARPVQGFVESAQRAELLDMTDLTLRRISRDVHTALPNSIRCGASGGLCGATAYSGKNYYFIEFISSAGGGSYHDEFDGIAGGITMNFIDASPCAGNLCKFDVIGTMPANPSMTANDYIVIANFSQISGSTLNCDAYLGDNRATVAGVAGSTVTLNAAPGGMNVFAANGGLCRSDTQGTHRFQLVKSNAKGVMYACPATESGASGKLLRFSNYGFNATLAGAITAATATTGEILADNVSCSATYAAHVSLQNTGLLNLTLTARGVPSGGTPTESISLLRQIHVDNSP